MKSEYIKWTNKALGNFLTEKLVSQEPTFRRGDTVSGHQYVRDGKIVYNHEQKDPVIYLTEEDGKVYNDEVPPAYVRQLSVAVLLSDFADYKFDIDKYALIENKNLYIHFISAVLQNRDFLEEYDVGDRITAATVFGELGREVLDVAVTQEMIDNRSIVLFVFGLSAI